MQCDECKANEANIHYTTITNGAKKEMHLCGACAKKLESMGAFKLINQNEFFVPFFGLSEKPQQARACPSCGTSLADFNATGYLGCAECYLEFQKELMPVIKRVQGSVKHMGKLPKSGIYSSVNEFERLSRELKKAIEEERYEEAAALRDKLKKFR